MPLGGVGELPVDPDGVGMGIRTIGMARAQAKLTLANLAYNSDRLIFHERCAATGKVCLQSAERTERPKNIAEKRSIGRSNGITRGNA